MRAITVRQPWAWAIVHGGKDVENRTRNIAGSYRGPVAVHAGMAKPEQHNLASRAHRAAHGTEVPSELKFGAIIGLVDLVDVHWGAVPEFECLPGSGWRPSPWAENGAFHLVLANPRPLPTPIPARGMLGLWTPPGDVLEQLRAVVR